MSELSIEELLDEITICDERSDDHGSSVEYKRESLNPILETVTSDNWTTFFPESRLSPDRVKELDNGSLYLRVALDPDNKNVAGFIEVRRNQDNGLTVEVSKDFQRRGVATTLITQAQKITIVCSY